jgi:hypothetical protein
LCCPNNSLIKINQLLFNLNPEKLKELDLSNNKFQEGNLKPFSKFINLESLSISDNNFHGSLEPLKDLTKLRELYAYNTNIDSGLEFLPITLEKFQCYDAEKKGIGVKATELYKRELHSFKGSLQT